MLKILRRFDLSIFLIESECTYVLGVSYVLPVNCLFNPDDAACVQVSDLFARARCMYVCMYACEYTCRISRRPRWFLFLSLADNRLLQRIFPSSRVDGAVARPLLWLVAPGWDKLCCTNTHNDRGKLRDSTRVRIGLLQRRPTKSKTDSIQDRYGKLTVLWFLCLLRAPRYFHSILDRHRGTLLFFNGYS